MTRDLNPNDRLVLPPTISVAGVEYLASGWRNGPSRVPTHTIIKAPWGTDITIERSADQKAKVYSHGSPQATLAPR